MEGVEAGAAGAGEAGVAVLGAAGEAGAGLGGMAGAVAEDEGGLRKAGRLLVNQNIYLPWPLSAVSADWKPGEDLPRIKTGRVPP